ncbi:MAG: TAXI family TRAP transporter solute-binding subunit [Hyphomicrobiaceae bacterium]
MKLCHFGIATILGNALVGPQVLAADVNLPAQISWTAYGTTSSGYAQSIGIGQMLKKNFNTGLRIIPGKNDVSRMVPLRNGQSPLCACGIASFFAQEGVFMFASRKWGPMKIYNIFNNIGDNGQQAVVAGDAGIKTIKDLKGKRVTWVKGAPALNTNMTAFLAFAGLGWGDVKRVVVPGWKQSADAVINGQADATWGSTVSSAYNKLAASPRGIYWVSLPHRDSEAWARARSVAPHWSPSKVTVGVALEKSGQGGGLPHEGMNYPYPIFVSTADATDNLAYGLTKAIMENYEQIKDAGPSMSGYQLSRQNLTWIFPYHPAAIKYYKERGVWGAQQDAHNNKLLKRQDTLASAWQSYVDKNEDADNASFAKGWQGARAEALEKAGLNVPFKSW